MNKTAQHASPELLEFAQTMRSEYRAKIPSTGAADPVGEVRSLNIDAENPIRKIPLRIYVPVHLAEEKLPIILFVHGGGFVSGDLDTHDVLTRALANRVHAIVVAVDYRLAPEHPFPAGIEDGYVALQWIFANASRIGGDSQRIATAGDSAGGNMATVLAIMARDRGGPVLKAQLLMYPGVSNKTESESWKQLSEDVFPTRLLQEKVIACYVPEGVSVFAPLIAPLWGDLRDLPPAFVQVGENDPLRDESCDYAGRLEAYGTTATHTVYKGATHGFIQFFKDAESHPLGEQGLQDAASFLRSALAN